ncbi:MAG TPA: hypothetical protein VH500_22005 [Nitrososphaeraceae archaeon]
MTEDGFIKEQNAPRDQLGAKTVNILFNFEVGTIYCVLDAPTKEAFNSNFTLLLFLYRFHYLKEERF